MCFETECKTDAFWEKMTGLTFYQQQDKGRRDYKTVTCPVSAMSLPFSHCVTFETSVPSGRSILISFHLLIFSVPAHLILIVPPFSFPFFPSPIFTISSLALPSPILTPLLSSCLLSYPLPSSPLTHLVPPLLRSHHPPCALGQQSLASRASCWHQTSPGSLWLQTQND